MKIEIALKNNRISKALTGLSIIEFEELVPDFEWNYIECTRKLKQKRIRKKGAGQKGSYPSIREKLFLILMYMKVYPTYDVMAFITDTHRSRCQKWVARLLPILEQTLGRKMLLPKRQLNDVSEFLRLYPEAKEIFVDGMERKVQKPVSQSRRKKLYSGKAKATTRKNIIISDKEKRILYLTKTKSGRRHDKRLYDKEDLGGIPEEVTIYADTGFIGMDKKHKKTNMPKRAYKNRPLTAEDKEYNRIVSSIRVTVEHAISGIKRFNSISQIYRNKKTNFDDMLALTASGLWNYHLSFK